MKNIGFGSHGHARQVQKQQNEMVFEISNNEPEKLLVQNETEQLSGKELPGITKTFEKGSWKGSRRSHLPRKGFIQLSRKSSKRVAIRTFHYVLIIWKMCLKNMFKYCLFIDHLVTTIV